MFVKNVPKNISSMMGSACVRKVKNLIRMDNAKSATLKLAKYAKQEIKIIALGA